MDRRTNRPDGSGGGAPTVVTSRSAGDGVTDDPDARTSDIDYYYVSRLPGEPLAGIADIHTHPSEPRAFRISLRARI